MIRVLLLLAGLCAQTAMGEVLLTESHDGWGKRKCESCHVLSRIHGDVPHIRAIAKEKGYPVCTGCHGSNGTDATRPCQVCHNATDLPQSPLQTGHRKHDFNVAGNLPLNDNQCAICHQASNMDGQWQLNIDLTSFGAPYQHESDFCLRCHNPSQQQPGFPVRTRSAEDSLTGVANAWTHIDKHGYPAGSTQGPNAGLRPPFHYGMVLECSNCHAMHGTTNSRLIIDNTRKSTAAPLRGGEIPIHVSAGGDFSQLCVNCHQMRQPSGDALKNTGNGLSGVHLVGTDCTLCHTHNKPGFFKARTTDVSLARGKLLLTPRHFGWNNPNCQSCHPISAIHDRAPHIRGIVVQKGFETCTGCHGGNGTDRPRRCLICHNTQDLPFSPQQTGAHQHDFNIDIDQPLEDRHCLVCHQAADMDGDWELAIDLTRAPDANGLNEPYQHEAEFCLRCHNRHHQQPGFPVRSRGLQDPLTAIEDTWYHMDEHGLVSGSGKRTYAGLRPPYRYGVTLACTDCHAMHGTDNPKHIIDNSTKGAFALEGRDLAVPIQVIDHGDYSQLCVLCHAMEKPLEDALIDTGNGLSGVHRVGDDCRLCHTHGQAAQVGL